MQSSDLAALRVRLRTRSRPPWALFLICTTLAIAALFPSGPATAAESGAPAWQSSDGLPFVGMLLSIALMPMLVPRFWHRRMAFVALFWALALLIPLGARDGARPAAAVLWHAAAQEYLPFVSLLTALFTIGGGIQVRGGPWGTPAGNTALLAAGTALAGVMGTTGASMTLIHPLLRANAHRTRKVHIVLFFILLVANAGGATSPLGDPPLYIGFLRGVPFFWPLRHLLVPMLVVAVLLLAAFYVLDRRLAAADPPRPEPEPEHFHVRGLANVVLLAVVVAMVLAIGVWRPGTVTLLGEPIGIERLVGVAVMLAAAALSGVLTPRAVHQYNMFSWDPMKEVALLFAVIFVTIAPVIGLLHQGLDGPLGGLLRMALAPDGTPQALPLFWMAGSLSAFLDNAPTYLVFFELAGGDPTYLAGPLAGVLTAIAAGSVFFGAITYIGNAPNLMVRAIAAHRGVRMPSFFGYMAWSCALLLPIFALQTILFFAG